MKFWIRVSLLAASLATTAWAWHGALLGAAAAWGVSATALVLCLWPTSSRRRRSALRYVEMAKDPVSVQ